MKVYCRFENTTFEQSINHLWYFDIKSMSCRPFLIDKCFPIDSQNRFTSLSDCTVECMPSTINENKHEGTKELSLGDLKFFFI